MHGENLENDLSIGASAKYADMTDAEFRKQTIKLLQELLMSSAQTNVSTTQLATDVNSLIAVLSAYATAYNALLAIVNNQTLDPTDQTNVNNIDATVDAAVAANPLPATASAAISGSNASSGSTTT
jgi:hypothetical protein